MNTLLIGPRGCGKSLVGQRLAEISCRPFVELDNCVLAMFAEKSVQEVWELQGEIAWRMEEVKQLAITLREDRQIVSLGGGTVTIDDAFELIKDEQDAGRAKLIYLCCEIPELVRRLKNAPGDRPALSDAQTPEEEVTNVLSQRDPIYRSLADIVIDVTNISVDEAATKLAGRLD
ncbi:MAG: shikimate kinase [Planctomycetes bacterium]|nr:shikimate kinase [Planctomycetota bacterium]